MSFLPGDIMISVLVVRLVVDEVGLPKKLLFRVLELTDHVGGLMFVLLVTRCVGMYRRKRVSICGINCEVEVKWRR